MTPHTTVPATGEHMTTPYAPRPAPPPPPTPDPGFAADYAGL